MPEARVISKDVGFLDFINKWMRIVVLYGPRLTKSSLEPSLRAQS